MTDTPIADRTDEQLVRTIAARMGWIKEVRHHHLGWERHRNGRYGLNQWETSDGPYMWFMPHESAADRERVALAMPTIAVKHYTLDDGTHVCHLIDTNSRVPQKTYVGTGEYYGLAFCRASNELIEAQESKDD